MNSGPNSMVRVGRGRTAAIILLGPAVGALSLFVLPMAFDPPAGGARDIAEMSVFFVLFGYMLGIVPSILAAALYSAAYPFVYRWSWPLLLLVCLALGALCGALGVALTISALERQLAIAPALVATGAWAGAPALALTALPFRKLAP